MKFHKHRLILTNRHVALQLRLKLFDIVVSPTLLFGLSTLPMTKSHLETLDRLQRKMLRNIVGWARFPLEEWSTTMRRMNARLEHAMQIRKVNQWSHEIYRKQFRFSVKVPNSERATRTKPEWRTLEQRFLQFCAGP